MTQPQRASTYFLDEVVISSPRLEDSIDVTNIMAELNLYESLTSPYISGDLMIVDSSAITSLIRPNGQETVTIKLFVDQDHKVERDFIIYSVRIHEKQGNDNTSLYVFSLIEKHGFYSNFVRLNSAYDGNISDIIYGIYDSVLFEEEEKKFLSKDNFQQAHQAVKIISPNKTPLGLAEWLKDRATSELGEPFFLYSSLKDGPLFQSLGELLGADIQNPNNPYRYTQVYTNVDFTDEIYRIAELKVPENDNSIQLARSGAFGVQYISIDPFNKTYASEDYQPEFNQNDYFKNKQNTLEDYNIYDDKFEIGPIAGNNTQEPPRKKHLAELQSLVYSQINTASSFGSEFKSYDEEKFIGDHMKKVRNKSDLAMLGKQKYSIIIPGYTMLNEKVNTSIGKVINILIPNDLPHVVAPEEDDLYDPKKSGRSRGLFLTTKVRHRFGMNSEYYCAVEISKIATDQKL